MPIRLNEGIPETVETYPDRVGRAECLPRSTRKPAPSPVKSSSANTPSSKRMARKPKPLIIGVGLIKRNDKVVISFSSADIGRLINDTGIQLAAGLDVDKAAQCLTGAIWSFIFSWRLETSSAPGYVIERVRKIERGARALRVELDGRFTGYWGKQLTKSVWPSTFCCGA
jgi:hypothetical protein